MTGKTMCLGRVVLIRWPHSTFIWCPIVLWRYSSGSRKFQWQVMTGCYRDITSLTLYLPFIFCEPLIFLSTDYRRMPKKEWDDWLRSEVYLRFIMWIQWAQYLFGKSGSGGTLWPTVKVTHIQSTTSPDPSSSAEILSMFSPTPTTTLTVTSSATHRRKYIPLWLRLACTL